jgi:hypothetical protein
MAVSGYSGVKRRVCAMAALAVFAIISCTTRSTLRFEKLADRMNEGDFTAAIESIRKNPNLYGKTNLFLYHMDLGSLYHYAGMYDSSSVHLLKASDVFDDLFARSVTNEAAAIMTNDNIRPYRSKPYELVMLHQLTAFDYLATGNFEDALVETRKVQLFFNEWNRKNKSGEKYDSDGMFNYISSIVYDAAGETSDAMISLYNAIKAYNAGPVPLAPELRDRAFHLFRLNDRESDNQTLSLTTTTPRERISGLENRSTEIIVIGYAGRGPSLEEESWWGTWVKDGLLVVHHNDPNGNQQTMTLPAPALPPGELRNAEKGRTTESGTTFHIKFALPRVTTVSSLTEDFSVRCSGHEQPYTSVMINDLEEQARNYLEDTRSVTMGRTVARVVLRTIAAQATKEQLQTNSTAANLLINIGTDILADQLEKADTRSCFLLPKTVHIVRVPVTPGTYTIEVTARGAGGSTVGTRRFENIPVRLHEKKFLFYPSFK